MKSVTTLVVGAALALGLVGCGARQQKTPADTTGDGPSSELTIYDRGMQAPAAADTEVNLTKLAGLITAGKVSSIRVIGDSQTAGYNLDGYDDESDTGIVVYEGPEGTGTEVSTKVRSWTNLFREYARDHGVTDFVNAGVSGWRMQYLAEAPDAWLDDGADVIVVMLGTNDAAKVSEEEFRSFAEQALSACDDRCEHLVVVAPPDNERTDATNLFGMDRIEAALSDVSEEHDWEFVSLYDALQVGTDDFQDDQVHPSESGSRKLWEAFRTKLHLP